MVLERITRGRYTDNLGGCHFIWTNQQFTSINPCHFYIRCPSCHNPSNLSWLGTGTGIWWIAYPRGLVCKLRDNSEQIVSSMCHCQRLVILHRMQWQPTAEIITNDTYQQIASAAAATTSHQIAYLLLSRHNFISKVELNQ